MADRTLPVLFIGSRPSCGTGSLQQCDEARDLAPFDLAFNGTRCTTNLLGVKGCGEAVAVAAFPAVANTIADALAPLGTIDLSGPAAPERIWRAMNDADQR